jgi:hypothetical protein
MEAAMKNTHTRELLAPIERIRPWIEAGWSGTPHDPLPRDVLRSWRKNPPGVDPLALVPEVTRLGHGPFSFYFESWDGQRWRMRIDSAGFHGWHGFDLEPTPRACLVTYKLEATLSSINRVSWRFFVGPAHDWFVEAILDRIEAALATGEMPATTRRKMPPQLALFFALLRSVSTRPEARRPGPNIVASHPGFGPSRLRCRYARDASMSFRIAPPCPTCDSAAIS